MVQYIYVYLYKWIYVYVFHYRFYVKICNLILISGNIYFLSQEFGLCSDSGSKTVETSNECRSAVSQIRNLDQRATFKEVNNSYETIGCSLFKRQANVVYWNTHITGAITRQPNRYQICISVGAYAQD